MGKPKPEPSTPAQEAPVEQAAQAKAEAKPGPMVVLKSESRPAPMAMAKAEPKLAKIEVKAEARAEAKPGPRFAVASAVSLPARLQPAAAATEPTQSEAAAAATMAQTRVIIGSTEPLQPVLVKTLTVRAVTKTASLVPVQVPSPAPEVQPIAAVVPASAVRTPKAWPK